MKTSLVVLAAGMGSRFGGLKQLQPLTADGRVLLDFSVDDAIKVGFDKIVFVIRSEMDEVFKLTLGARTEQKIQVEYVYQDITLQERSKPLGTGHALLCCKGIVREPFAVINADDYYGIGALKQIYDYLLSASKDECAMVAYKLGNTVSDNGEVTRGICNVSDGFLRNIIEQRGITGKCNAGNVQFDVNTPVSMNLWGFFPNIFDMLQSSFDKFLQTADLKNDEFILSTAINDFVEKSLLAVRVFETDEPWVGMTHRQDLPRVRDFVLKLGL